MSTMKTFENYKDATEEVFLEADENKTLLYFPNFMESHTTWQEVVDHIDTQHGRTDEPYGKHDPIRSRDEGLKHLGGLEIRSHFHMISQAPHFPGVFADCANLMNKLEEMYGQRTAGASGLINLVTSEPPIMLHWDNTPSFYWQGIGNVRWQRHEGLNTDDTPTDVITTSPGDAIYVPPTMWHKVYSLTPRFALSMQQHPFKTKAQLG